jgi:molybdopterin-synthase adenylyltransferase
LPGVVGAMMATEAVKHLSQAGQTLRGRLFIYDALYGQSRVILLSPDSACPVCRGAGPEITLAQAHK